MKILFLPMDGHGHVNACLGLGQILRGVGHDCVFLVPTNWFVLVKGDSFTLEPLDLEGSDTTKDPQDVWADYIRGISPSFKKSPGDQLKDFLVTDMMEFVGYVKQIDDKVSRAIKKINPDLIIVDFYVTIPAVVNSGKPWILLCSSNPLFAYNSPNTPPHYSGLGATDPPEMFIAFRELVTRELAKVKIDADNFLKSKGLQPHPTELISISPYLNIYSYPEDLDYSEFGPIPEKWFRLDHMVREAEEGPIGFDESFLSTNDKIVFFSLGSMGCADVDLMNRLIGFMSESKHRFIISKGPYHQQIKLYDNMIGEKYLNQIKILPKVDLVITHGGNNTFIEAIYFGKPIIVLPLFGDQHDNARRTVDRNIGKALDPYKVTKEQFLSTIDEILGDEKIIKYVEKIGSKIRRTESHKQLNDRLKNII